MGSGFDPVKRSVVGCLSGLIVFTAGAGYAEQIGQPDGVQDAAAASPASETPPISKMPPNAKIVAAPCKMGAEAAANAKPDDGSKAGAQPTKDVLPPTRSGPGLETGAESAPETIPDAGQDTAHVKGDSGESRKQAPETSILDDVDPDHSPVLPAPPAKLAVDPTITTPVAPIAQSASATCPADVVWLRGDFGKARFSVDVADTRALRAQGLMNVPQMPGSRGMLFVYDYPQKVAFWMKNTLIALDIIYADEQGIVSSIQANAVPGDLTPLPGLGLVQYVLEINGGLAARLGIKPGAQIQHPAIFSPAWPCE